jgi:three-Cys-motif partner protein
MMSKPQNVVKDDGYCKEAIGKWSTEKHDLIKIYAEIFSAGMKDKWKYRVYLDLFSGAGYGKVRETSEIVHTSPLLALNLKNKFNKYIFCEIEKEKINALKQRVKRDYSETNVSYIEGDVNRCTETILEEIPQSVGEFNVLCFCVVDPYSLKNLVFKTIKKISERRIDFFVLIPTYVDANRNIGDYIKKNNRIVERFLGSENWRDDWDKFKREKGDKFGFFIMTQFCDQMGKLGYFKTKIEDVIFKRGSKNQSLYHLVFFSRHKRGIEFWKKAIKSSEK